MDKPYFEAKSYAEDPIVQDHEQDHDNQVDEKDVSTVDSVFPIFGTYSAVGT